MGTWEQPGDARTAGSVDGPDGGAARPAPWRPAATPPPLASQLAEPDQTDAGQVGAAGTAGGQLMGAGIPGAGAGAAAVTAGMTPGATGAAGAASSAPRHSTQPGSGGATPELRPDLVLVEDSRQQGSEPAAAAELFTGDVFRRARAYAKASGAPWFILSAEYGLLAPDQVVAPYDRSMATAPTAYREAWGPWVLARLETMAGSVRRMRIEMHAVSQAASEGLRRQLLGNGATVLEPLRGLSVQDRIAWYDRLSGAAGRAVPGSGFAADDAAARLGDASQASRPSTLLASVDAALRGPGLYSWFVDETGAQELTEGLGAHVAPGLVWVGQAGAVRPGSGMTSTTNLRNQISWVHLGRSVRLSPLRRVLGAALSKVPEAEVANEDQLTDWMHDHLRVGIAGSEAPERLAEVAEEFGRRLAPQLSPEHSADPQLRAAVAAARTGFDAFPAQ